MTTPRQRFGGGCVLYCFLGCAFGTFPCISGLTACVRGRAKCRVIEITHPPRRVFVPRARCEINTSPRRFLTLIHSTRVVLAASFRKATFTMGCNGPIFAIMGSEGTDSDHRVDLVRGLKLRSRMLSVISRFPSGSHFACGIGSRRGQLRALHRGSGRCLVGTLGSRWSEALWV